jgi:iron complex transport system ATP-binding protein
VITGLISPTEGTILRRGSCGYVPQATQLAFSYRVRDVVTMGRARHVGLLGSLHARDRDAIAAAISQVGIEHLAEREFSELSGGQRQLVLIARAFASESEIIILDEPMSSLDLRNQRRMLDLFSALAADRRTAIVFSTHQPAHAFRVASTVLLLGEGRQPEFGDTLPCLSEKSLSQLYGVDMRIVEIANGSQTTRHAVPIF